MFRILRYTTYLIIFFTIWILWPRELDGYLLGRDGRESVPDYAMVNARYVSMKEGRIEIESAAKDAAFDFIHRQMIAQSVISFIYNDKKEKTTVTADKAFYFMEDRKMNLLGNVHSISPEGFELLGPEANYYLNKKFFEAPLPIAGVSKEKDLRVWGDRAESNLNESKIYLIGNARSEFVDKKRGITKIRGERSELDRATNEVQFFKNVRLDQQETIATGQRARLFFDKNKHAVSYMSVLDDAEIRDKSGKYTRSQVAEFFTPTDTIVLTGFPSVYDGDDAVTGDKITLYRATGVVEVTATNASASTMRSNKNKPNHEITEEDKELIP